MIEKRDIEEHERVTSNYRGHLSTLATRLSDDGDFGPAGVLLVLERIVYRFHTDFSLALGQVVDAPPPPPAAQPAGKRTRAPKGQGTHRHTFDAAGACACGAARKRARKGSAAAQEQKLDAAARTMPLPIGDNIPDRFDGGAFGSSSTSERSR